MTIREVLQERLELRLSLHDREGLEALAAEDGVTVSEEVRKLIGREVKRRKSKREAEARGVPRECLGCALAGHRPRGPRAMDDPTGPANEEERRSVQQWLEKHVRTVGTTH